MSAFECECNKHEQRAKAHAGDEEEGYADGDYEEKAEARSGGKYNLNT